mmetsp:Transcript_21038/g.49966  ORF Transcript_21038/g.49966 Transcript_21038/m.49966 type:complete len:244 (+) Transcript_21038:429-1160(+)
MQSRNRRSRTCASTAASGSSSRYTSASWYAARANATRAFCPPLMLMPFSPISVMSPARSVSRSRSRQHTCKTWSYRWASKGAPSRMLSLRVPLKIHGCCPAYATLPDRVMLPLSFLISPRTAESSDDLPDPTFPVTMHSSPISTWSVICFSAVTNSTGLFMSECRAAGWPRVLKLEDTDSFDLRDTAPRKLSRKESFVDKIPSSSSSATHLGQEKVALLICNGHVSHVALGNGSSSSEASTQF